MLKRNQVIVGAIFLAAVARILPHWPNVTPITAMALFSGAMLPNKRLAFLVPLAAMLLGDIALDLAKFVPFLQSSWLATGWGLHRGMWVIYATFCLIVGIGLLLRRRRNVMDLARAVLASSVVFFIVTNFAVWLGSEALYPRTLAGLVDCYVMALPFFGWTLFGDAVYTAILFGGFALLEQQVPGVRALFTENTESAWRGEAQPASGATLANSMSSSPAD